MGYNIKSKRVKTGEQFTIQTKPASFKRKFEVNVTVEEFLEKILL